MFAKYLRFIEELINVIKTGEGTLAFTDYLSVLGNTFLLIGVIVVIFGIFYGSFSAPRLVYKKTVGKIYSEFQSLVKNNEIEKIKPFEKRLRNAKIIYFTLFTVVYIPFIIPTILYILYIVFHI